MDIVYVFLASGVVGWVILSLFSGELEGHLWKTYGVPFKPMFAVGAVMVFLLYQYTSRYPVYVQLLFYGGLFTVLEYLMFQVSDKVFNARFQCYYNGKRLALLYSIYWALMGTVMARLYQGTYDSLTLTLAGVLVVLAAVFRDGRIGLVKLDKTGEYKIC